MPNSIAKVVVYAIASTVAIALPTAHFLSIRHHYSISHVKEPETELEPYEKEDDTNQIKYSPETLSEYIMTSNSKAFYELMKERRMVRFIKSTMFPKSIIENIILTAGTAIIHHQPVSFIIISRLDIKNQIKRIIEEHAKLNYERQASKNTLNQVGTPWKRQYLSDAPYLILVCKNESGNGKRLNQHYVDDSVAIATGFLVAAIHNAGLCTVTTNPMNTSTQICDLLGRPKQERITMLLPVGYAADDATVPDILRKPLGQIASFYE